MKTLCFLGGILLGVVVDAALNYWIDTPMLKATQVLELQEAYSRGYIHGWMDADSVAARETVELGCRPTPHLQTANYSE